MNTERVFVNFQVETKKTKQIKEGDMITIRGKGRFFIKEIIGQTRSGRTILKVEKFVAMESLLKNVVNGWKTNLMLQKFY